MMRKPLSLLLCLCLLLCISACGGGTESAPSPTTPAEANAPANPETEAPAAAPEADQSKDNASPSGSKILVAYFSLAGEQYEVGVIEKGNTEIVAEMIAEATGADTYKIESTTEYPTTYDGLLDVSRQEESDPPEIAGTLPDLAEYDTIFLGYPIWWGDVPTIIRVFLQSGDFSGKTIVPFCTHGGSALSGTDQTIGELCPNATIGTGLAIRGSTAQNDRDAARESVTKWLAEGGYVS